MEWGYVLTVKDTRNRDLCEAHRAYGIAGTYSQGNLSWDWAAVGIK